MAKKTKTSKFNEFEKDVNTASYPPPKQIVKIPDEDKGYAIVSSGFNNQKPYFTPGIKSINKDLKKH